MSFVLPIVSFICYRCVIDFVPQMHFTLLSLISSSSYFLSCLLINVYHVYYYLHCALVLSYFQLHYYFYILNYCNFIYYDWSYYCHYTQHLINCDIVCAELSLTATISLVYVNVERLSTYHVMYWWYQT